MPNSYVSNGPRAPSWASGRLPLLDADNHKDTAPMKSDAFGGTPAANPAPVLPAPGNASPPPAAVNAPAAAPPPAPAVNVPPAPAMTQATAATAAPAGKGKAAAPAPHMPKVGTVTAGNPTGDPNLDGEGKPLTGEGSNSAALEAKKKELTETVSTLGKTKGAGANSRGELAVLVCQAARDGVISVVKGSTDVADIYEAFSKGQSGAQIDDVHLERGVKNVATSVSKLAIFAKLGAVQCKFDTARVLAKARELVPKVKDAKMTTYDALRLVAKTQIAACKADPKAKPMSDAQIKALLLPDADDDGDERTHAEHEYLELTAIVKRMQKLQDGTTDRGPAPSDELQRCIAILHSRAVVVGKKVEAERGPEASDEAA